MVTRNDPGEPGDRASATAALPGRIAPMLAVAGELPLTDAGWAYEVKWDGVRAIVYAEHGRVRALSRGDRDLAAAFPELAEAAALLGRHSAILDGEVIALDPGGLPSFGLLQQRMHLTGASRVASRAREILAGYVVFDLLHLDGESLLPLPYDERRARLESLGLAGRSVVTGDSHREVSGRELAEGLRRAGFEGVVAKRRESPYRPGRRSGGWRKVKNFITQEIVLGGWTAGEGQRAGSLGALLMGIPDELGLRYAGKVGTGFSAAARADLLRRLAPLASAVSPFADPLERAEVAAAHWVRPVLVGEVRYGTRTADGRLRHAAWRGLRFDKDPADVRDEGLRDEGLRDEGPGTRGPAGT